VEWATRLDRRSIEREKLKFNRGRLKEIGQTLVWQASLMIKFWNGLRSNLELVRIRAMENSWAGKKKTSGPFRLNLYVTLTRSFSASLVLRSWLWHFD
jgi:hypothetical protein